MLHLKYRPKEWKEVIGNEDAVKYLQAAVSSPNRPHSYLMQGPSGSGKTTLARILATELGSSPPDLVEIDVGDYRGIDSIRDIRQVMTMAPMISKARVWILDEVHRCTSDAQAALLKALEDTPPHTYFLLATTDPQKLLPTIRNRCTPIKVEHLSDDDMEKLLIKVSRRERFRLSKEALQQLIEIAEGTPRTALVALEKHITNPEASIVGINENSREIKDLCQLLLKKQSWNAVRKCLADLKGNDPEDIRRAVLGYAAAVMLKDDNSQALVILDIFREPFYNSGWPGVVWASSLCIQKDE